MRNRVSSLIVLAGLLTLPVVAWGQTPAAPGAKIGVINFQGAIGNTAEGKKAVQELTKKYEPRTRELQQSQQEIQNLTEQLQKQAATLSDDEQRRLARELEDKQKRFKRGQEDYQADIQAEQQEIVQRLGQKMFRLVNEYGQANGFALIMEGYPQVPVYFAPIDVTEELIKRYDAAFPAEIAAPAAGTTAPPAAKPAAPASKPSTAAKPADKPKP